MSLKLQSCWVRVGGAGAEGLVDTGCLIGALWFPWATRLHDLHVLAKQLVIAAVAQNNIVTSVNAYSTYVPQQLFWGCDQ